VVFDPSGTKNGKKKEKKTLRIAPPRQRRGGITSKVKEKKRLTGANGGSQ